MSPKYNTANETYNQLLDLKKVAYDIYDKHPLIKDKDSELCDDFGYVMDACMIRMCQLFEIPDEFNDEAFEVIASCFYKNDTFDYIHKVLKLREII